MDLFGKQEISLYLDCYSSLLTEHAVNVMNLYANEDLSINEIASLLKISKQAVYDRLTKGKAQIIDLEEKLSLFKHKRLLLNNLMLFQDLLVDVKDEDLYNKIRSNMIKIEELIERD